jgi:hypothetical protein
MNNTYAIARKFIYGLDFTEYDEDVNVIVYHNKLQAERELKDYIDSCNHAYDKGYTETPYDDDCIVVEVTLEADGYTIIKNSNEQ